MFHYDREKDKNHHSNRTSGRIDNGCDHGHPASPTPTLGYIHLGDGMVLICVILLGPGLGAAAAGIGSMLADLFAGAVAYMPGTLVIKALTALVGGWVYHRLAGHASLRTPVRVAIAGIPAELVMVAGYFVYEAGMQIVAGSAVGAAAAAMAGGRAVQYCAGTCGHHRRRSAAACAQPRERRDGRTYQNLKPAFTKDQRAVLQRLFFHARSASVARRSSRIRPQSSVSRRAGRGNRGLAAALRQARGASQNRTGIGGQR